MLSRNVGHNHPVTPRQIPKTGDLNCTASKAWKSHTDLT